MLNETGIPTAQDLLGVTPEAERRSRGAVAVLECFQEIPCNPCIEACPKGAIKPFVDINRRPRLDPELCNGCGNCVARCPGLAIFVVDESYEEDQALIKIPYEFLPLPAAGGLVNGLDREGRIVTSARIIKVQLAKSQNRTGIIWLAVPKDLVMTVRNISLRGVIR